MEDLSTLHIEVSRTRRPTNEAELETKLASIFSSLSIKNLEAGKKIDCNEGGLQEVKDFVEFITVGECVEDLETKKREVIVHLYKNVERGPEIETFETGHGDNFEEVPALNHWLLPSKEFEGLWESLYYGDKLKENLVKFVQTMMLFSKQKVDTNIISCNRLVLLHGPPGTGKTSLCKAIAQKLAIRMGKMYKHTHLIEINSHSLFSKWFSESGKLVMKLFSTIRDIVENPNSLVCVLIDEVESIAYARSSVSGEEPRDALRVVNAVLTQLDQIRKYPNVLVLTTSNLTSTIDLAFIDRADIKQYIGYPSTEAIYEIYTSALEELIRAKIISLPHSQYKNSEEIKNKLIAVCDLSLGLSGRTLRKIPFLAHALFVQKDHTEIDQFLDAMQNAIIKNRCDQISLVKEENRVSQTSLSNGH